LGRAAFCGGILFADEINRSDEQYKTYKVVPLQGLIFEKNIKKHGTPETRCAMRYYG
jgi:hypothetical protein